MVRQWNNTVMSAVKQLLLGNVASSATAYSPNAVKFDGANDYLTRGADLTGIADSKSGIFSAWIRLDGYQASYQFLLQNNASLDRVGIYITASNGSFAIYGKNSAATIILNIGTAAGAVTCPSAATTPASAKWYHILASWNLATGTSATSVYINDVAATLTTNTATNDTIDYATTSPDWGLCCTQSGSYRLNGSVSEYYFSPGQYLDFSNSTNRRKFIDASGLPVSLGSDGSTPTGSAPAIYLKGDSSAFGTNSGTGGNFTVNGTLEKASTTPATLPAYNAVKYDGSADYLKLSSDLTGLADGKSGILSCWIRINGDGAAARILNNLVTADGFYWQYTVSSHKFTFIASNASATNILVMTTTSTYYPSPDYLHVLASWDLATSTTHLYINGVSDKTTTTATNDTINYATTTPAWAINATTSGGSPFNGAISELYFAPNQYLDLSVQANREKFILNGAPVSLGADGSTPTGTAPAIYLPNRAALVGTNAGSGGNFTINGAPKDANSTPVYYYAEPARFDGTNDYLTRGGDLTGIADGKAGTISFWLRLDGGNGSDTRILENTSAVGSFIIQRDTNNHIVMMVRNPSGSLFMTKYGTTALTASAVWVHVLMSWDLAATTFIGYISNVSETFTGSTVNDTIDYATSTPNWSVCARDSGLYKVNGAIADLWFNTTYLDISQASNRAKFIDQTTLRPVPLGAKGELPTGSQPLLYLGRDYANFQTNLGSGGNFTVTGALERATTSPSDISA